jgi:hypothetical protein
MWDDDEIGGRIYLQACHLFTAGLAADQKSRVIQHAVSVLHKLTATKYHMNNYGRLELAQKAEWEARFKAEPDFGLREAHELIAEVEAFLFQVKSSLDMLVKLLIPIVGTGTLKTHTYGNKGEDLEKGLKQFRRNGAANAWAVDALTDLVQRARQTWIETTVSMRDRFSHYAALTGLRFQPIEWPSGWIEARSPTLDGEEIWPKLRKIYQCNLEFQQDFMATALCLKSRGVKLVLESPSAMESSWKSAGGRFIKWGVEVAG